MKALLIAAGLALMLFAPELANAAPCQTGPTQGAAAMAFPKNDGTDVAFVRAMPPSIFATEPDKIFAPSTCERGRIATAHGDYLLTGENGETPPRRALPAGGANGTAVYLVSDNGRTGAEPVYMLIVHEIDNSDHVVTFFRGIPDDQTLLKAVASALGGGSAFINVDRAQRIVSYSVPGGVLGSGDVPPSPNGGAPYADGTRLAGGPQLFVTSANPMEFLEAAGENLRHKPSGLSCPQKFEGAAILLQQIDPGPSKIVCTYKVGTDFAYNPNAELRYQLMILNDPNTSAESAFTQIRGTLKSGETEYPPPLASGPSPAPSFATFVRNSDNRVAGTWIAKTGPWMVLLRAAYQSNSATDAEAAIVAQQIFSTIFNPTAP